MDRIAIIVGSDTDTTKRQLEYLKDNLLNSSSKLNEYFDISLFYISGNNFSLLKDIDFLSSFKQYKALILSGGDTAYSILHAAEFDYLESGEQILPLISTGTVHGGMLDGKKYIIKGGSLGSDDIYIKLLQHLFINTM
jgi:uncharacterized protein YgbK (DUF1537 family)